VVGVAVARYLLHKVLVSGSHAECFELAFPDDDDDFPEYELP
jgi:hypothetical protein